MKMISKLPTAGPLGWPGTKRRHAPAADTQVSAAAHLLHGDPVGPGQRAVGGGDGDTRRLYQMYAEFQSTSRAESICMRASAAEASVPAPEPPGCKRRVADGEWSGLGLLTTQEPYGLC